jgi:hypothetical protein
VTLRLVSDSPDNVVAFSGVNLRDTANAARKYADFVDEGRFGEVIRATVIIETGHGHETLFWGDVPSINEAVGIFEIAKTSLIQRLVEGEFDDD